MRAGDRAYRRGRPRRSTRDNVHFPAGEPSKARQQRHCPERLSLPITVKSPRRPRHGTKALASPSAAWRSAARSCAIPPPRPRARLFFLPPYKSRSQPDRAGVRQAEAFPAKSRRAHRPRHVEAHRNPPRRLQSRRMRKLFRQFRIRFRVESSRSR
jgi:hypothetical protein